MICLGLDMGSRYTKAVLMDESSTILGSAVMRTQPPFVDTAAKARAMVLDEAGLSEADIDYTVTTGFARFAVPFRQLQITDMTCAARGAIMLFPETRTVLDIGFQSTRTIRVLPNGHVKEFKTNDKCAAGAGGFVERSAKYLEVTLDQVGELSQNAKAPVTISSVCAVLAESEIINHVSDNRQVEDILRGVHNSLATRALGLMRRIGVEAELTMVGGMALQAGMIEEVAKVFQMKVNVPENPPLATAMGAARLGLNRALAKRAV